MLTVGAAEAMPGRASRPSARTARQVDALRISFSSDYLMDRSASIRVAPEPCRSGESRSPQKLAGNSGDFYTRHYPYETIASSCTSWNPAVRVLSSPQLAYGSASTGTLCLADRQLELGSVEPHVHWLEDHLPGTIFDASGEHRAQPQTLGERHQRLAGSGGAVERIAGSHVEGRVGRVRVETGLRDEEAQHGGHLGEPLDAVGERLWRAHQLQQAMTGHVAHVCQPEALLDRRGDQRHVHDRWLQ